MYTSYYTHNRAYIYIILHVIDAEEVSADKPVVISKYILNAKEIEFDAVAQVTILLFLSCCYYYYFYPYHAATTIAIPLLLLYLLPLS